jgi:hypothetical protein
MRRTLLAAALLALAIFPVTATSGQQDGVARADKEGWWNRTTGGASDTPAGGVVPPAVLPESVPEGAIAVAAVGGEPQKVAALGVVLDAPRGSVVEQLVLTLKEAEGTGAQQNPEEAAIVACPIVDFFAGVENGSFQDAPEADCEVASATGERAEDGTWTFDLTAIADAWLDPFGTVGANGIRFDPVEGTFQVSFTGVEDATFDGAITPGVEDEDPFDSTPTSIAGGFSSGSTSSGGGSIDVAPPPVVDAPGTDVTVADAEVGDVEDVADAGEDEVAAPAVSRAGDVSGNQPLGAYLIALIALAGLVLVSLHAGAARLAAPVRAGRGVSRALASRTTDTGGSSA